MPRAQTKVLFVSPLPPPPGGIATLTSIIFQNGLGPDHALACVDTNVLGRPLHGKMALGPAEIWRNLRILGKLLWKLIFFHPHIVHINSGLSRVGILRDAIAALTTRATGKKVVTHYHGSAPEFVGKGGAPVWLLRGLIRLSHINIASNAASRACLIRAGAEERSTLYLPNFIDESRFAATEERRADPKVRALYVGGLTKSKGAFDAVTVAVKTENFELTMVSASMAEEFLALKDNLPGNVVVRLGLSHEELVRAYGSHDLFLFMSYHEGFPLSVTEAMAMGLPVLATKVGSVADMIEEGKGGWLIEPGDVAAAVAALKKIAGKEPLAAMGRHNKEKFSQNYRFSVVAERLKAVYAGLL